MEHPLWPNGHTNEIKTEKARINRWTLLLVAFFGRLNIFGVFFLQVDVTSLFYLPRILV